MTRNHLLLAILVSLLALGATLAAVGAPESPAPAAGDTTDPPILVELFTSQGCSSCPPADRLLARLAREEGFVTLSFHVDYWNRLGWRDPFSSAAYSARQAAYAERLSPGHVYTPQAVVQGRAEVLGSDESAIRKAAARARAASRPLSLELTARRDGSAIVGRAGVDLGRGADEPLELTVILVRERAVTDVPRGENRGRELTHVSIVLGLETVATLDPGDSQAHGTARLPLPAGLEADDVHLVATLRNPATLAVAGVARSRVSGEPGEGERTGR